MPGEALGRADLLRWRLPSFRAKLDRARELVADALAAARRPVVAFSGGKDSLVVLALVLEQAPRVPALWSDDELEYDETPAYIADLAWTWRVSLVAVAGHATHGGWFTAWSDPPSWREPLPGTIAIPERHARDWARRQGYDGTFLGLRRRESVTRRTYLSVSGPLWRSAHGWQCSPLAGWTTDEVWAAIAGLELPYNPVYDTLARIGVPRAEQRVGPLPLAKGWHLRLGWPETHRRLLARYGDRWGG